MRATSFFFFFKWVEKSKSTEWERRTVRAIHFDCNMINQWSYVKTIHKEDISQKWGMSHLYNCRQSREPGATVGSAHLSTGWVRVKLSSRLKLFPFLGHIILAMIHKRWALTILKNTDSGNSIKSITLFCHYQV